MEHDTVIISRTHNFEARARGRRVHLYSLDRHRGGLMTGYGILLTLDSCIRYTSVVPVSEQDVARQHVPEYPRIPRAANTRAGSAEI